ncbi:DUF6578 domain-containing protein [Nonomuraea africana]|uniref:Uncharacterized protein n=1 Tax=Nonomuraea africana TaxID=46171 RepID=A0ABR9KRZ8_9ACTN|nr:DUF6578 domain-containing protein [Nonomuraea africana]MBE1564789.1 hypothetical protein [Nonomuraea africana]
MDLVVWVDDWQMQCCGDPFGVGSRVSWKLGEPDRDWLATVLGDVRVDKAEDHHLVPADTPVTEAVVTAISAVHCAYAPKPGATSPTMYAVEGSAVLSPVESAERWTKNLGDRKFVGYLVHLRTS